MGDTRVAVQKSHINAITPSYTGSLTATTETYIIRNNGRTFVHLKKSGAGICTVTMTRTAGGNHTFEVPASTGDKMAGPFPTSIYNDEYGDLRLVFNDIAGLTIATAQL